MDIPADFKLNVFKTMDEYLPIGEFETWLYASAQLQNLMDNDVVLDAFIFNCKQRDASYQFRKVMLSHFDEDEFMLWKVKSNLHDLIQGSPHLNRILNDFYRLGCNVYPYLVRLGSIIWEIEDIGYYGSDIREIRSRISQEAKGLLAEIEKQESEKPGCRLSDYRPSAN